MSFICIDHIATSSRWYESDGCVLRVSCLLDYSQVICSYVTDVLDAAKEEQWCCVCIWLLILDIVVQILYKVVFFICQEKTMWCNSLTQNEQNATSRVFLISNHSFPSCKLKRFINGSLKMECTILNLRFFFKELIYYGLIFFGKRICSWPSNFENTPILYLYNYFTIYIYINK